MTLTLGPILASAGIDPRQTLAIRHAYIREHEDSGLAGLHADSTDDEVLHYTSRQSLKPGVFAADPPQVWLVFIKEGGDRARLWSVVQNHGDLPRDGNLRAFDLICTDHLLDLRNRLVIGWRAPRAWWIKGTTVADYPVMEIADREPIPFPGFDHLILSYPELLAVMREPRYASWLTALGAVHGIYLITDTRDGRQYVGKADGTESIRQRWSAYASNGHGGNVELRGLDPGLFRYSILRVFDPSTPAEVINRAENHFKEALGTRKHGLNRN